MVPHWFRSPTALILIPILLLLMGAVACGPSEQSDTDAPADTKAKDTGSGDTGESVKDTGESMKDGSGESMKDGSGESMKDDGVSQPKDAGGEPMDGAMTKDAGDGMERLVIAVSPLGWDTNYSYKVTTSGLLDKRPVLEYLIANDRVTGAYAPELATSWEMSPDGLTWSITLQEGVKWQAGPHSPPEGWGDFTAEDVKHSFWLLIHPDSAASGIGGWRNMTGVKKDMTYPETYAVIDDFVEIIDPLTFKIHTPTVIAEMEFFLAHSRNFPIESKARWDAIGHEGYGDAIVGTGPLKFIERKEGVHVRYEAVPDHWRHTPDYQELEFRWVQEPATRLATLLTEDVQLSDIERASRPQALKKGMTIIRSTQPAMFNKWYFGGLYWTEPDKLDPTLPFLKKDVRKAMNKAINREAIAQAFLGGSQVRIGGESIYGFDPTLDEAIWPGLINPKWAEDWDEAYGYDPVAAKQLLVDAGYPEGFEFTLYLFTQAGLPEMVDIGQAMALDFAEIGITANLINLEFSKVRKLYRSQDPDIVGSSWPSRSQHRTNYSIAGSVTNSTTSHRWQREDTDAISVKLGETVDKAGRTALFREWGDIVYYDYMYMQMFALFADIMANPKYIVGYDFPGVYSGYYGGLEYVDTIAQ